MTDTTHDDLTAIDGGLSIWCPIEPIELVLVDENGEIVNKFPLPFPFPCPLYA